MADKVNNSAQMDNDSNSDIYSNISAAVATPAPVTLSSVELWIQLVFFFIFFYGFVTNCIGTCIWVGILRKKELRTRFFIIIGFLTFCRTCHCTNMLAAGVFRSLGKAGIASFYQRRLVCHVLSFWLIYGFVLEQVMLLLLVIDRMIALIAFVYYRSLTDRSATYVCFGVYAAVFIFVSVPSFVLDDMMEVAPCVNGDSFLNPYFNKYKTNLCLAIVGAIFVLYCVLIFYVRVRAKSMEAVANKSDAAKASLQRQLKLMPIFRNIVLMHCGFTFLSKLLNVLSTFVPPVYGQRLNAVGGLLSFFDVFFNMLTLLMSNADLREAAIPCWRKNHVTSLQGTASGQK